MKKIYSNVSITAISYRKKNKFKDGTPRNYYDYQFTDGYRYRVFVEEDNVPQEVISSLYDMDNADAINNCRKDRPEWTEVEKEQLRRYEETHYDSHVGKNWTESLDKLVGSLEGKDLDSLSFMMDRWYETQPEEPKEVKRLWEIIHTLSHDEQALITMIFFDGLSYREAGKVFGITKQAVDKRLSKIFTKIRKDF